MRTLAALLVMMPLMAQALVMPHAAAVGSRAAVGLRSSRPSMLMVPQPDHVDAFATVAQTSQMLADAAATTEGSPLAAAVILGIGAAIIGLAVYTVRYTVTTIVPLILQLGVFVGLTEVFGGFIPPFL